MMTDDDDDDDDEIATPRSIARDVPVEYARAPIAVIVVAHMGANAVFLPNAKSADRADMMNDKSLVARCDDWMGMNVEGCMGRDEWTGHDSRWISTRHEQDVHKNTNIGRADTWRDDERPSSSETVMMRPTRQATEE